MAVPHDHDPDAPPVAPFSEEPALHPVEDSPSIVDLLKQDVAELESVEEVYIPVKGFEKTGLAVKYHLPDKGKELDDIARKVQREFKDDYSRNLYIGIDTMLKLCSGLYVKSQEAISDDNPEGWVELDPNNIGEPVRFDERLAETLGWKELKTARAVVRRLFAGNELAINAHAERLNRWLANTKADVSLEFWQLGE